MGKPSKKLKKTLLILGVTGAVYLSFRYLLPLVIPFLAAYGIALGLKPSAHWMAKKVPFLSVGMAGGIQFLFLLVLVSVGIYIGGAKLAKEAMLLTEQIPVWIRALDVWLTGQCHNLEQLLYLEPDCLVLLAREMLTGLMRTWKENTMPFLMFNSMTVLRVLIQISVAVIILFVAVVLSLQEMEELKRRREHSIFRREFALLGTRVAEMGKAYLKTQGSILLLTMVICTVGLFFMKNPYYILLGIGIGLLDAFPVFGTGTVFIPWILFSLFSGSWDRALSLTAIYLVCYLLRQILEAKLMGDQVGLTPWETLFSMYVGLQLFGLLGFILGPMGLLLIEDLVEAYESPS